jgi:hypothetical protein
LGELSGSRGHASNTREASREVASI